MCLDNHCFSASVEMAPKGLGTLHDAAGAVLGLFRLEIRPGRRYLCLKAFGVFPAVSFRPGRRNGIFCR